MKRFTIIIFSFFNFLIAANAQQAGDIISGTVNDEMGPVMMANVVEIDAAKRIVASTVTDMNGRIRKTSCVLLLWVTRLYLFPLTRLILISRWRMPPRFKKW